MITPAPKEEEAKQVEPVDSEAAKTARERIEQEKLRRGRRSLRTDATAANTQGGAGVAIPG